MNKEMVSAYSIRVNSFGFIFIFVITLMFLYYMIPSSSNDNGTDDQLNVRALLSVCIDLAESGGKEIKAVREERSLNQKTKGKTKEGADEMLTQGDLRSHRVVVSGLSLLYPHMRVISEEKDPMLNVTQSPFFDQTVHPELSDLPNELIPASELSVWVDPLDATQEFTEDLDEYVTVMLCVVRHGKPLLGVIHFPFEKRTVWSWRGRGHSKLEKTPESKMTRIIVSRSHAGDVTKVARDAFGKDSIIIPAGGAGYKSVQVASGKADAYLHVTAIKKWDICAGHALLHSMGGQMTALNGGDIDFSPDLSPKVDGLIATATKRKYSEVLKKLVPSLAKKEE